MLEFSVLVALELQELQAHGVDEVEERSDAGLGSEDIFVESSRALPCGLIDEGEYQERHT